MYLQSLDVSACRDADLIGARVSWSPLVLLLERASVKSRVVAFRHESSSKNRRLRIRLRSTMRDPNTIYHFEALGVDRCCAHDPSVNSPQAPLEFGRNPSSSSLHSRYPEPPFGSLLLAQDLVASPDILRSLVNQRRLDVVGWVRLCNGSYSDMLKCLD